MEAETTRLATHAGVGESVAPEVDAATQPTGIHSSLEIAALSPSCASEMSSLPPSRPRRARVAPSEVQFWVTCRTRHSPDVDAIRDRDSADIGLASFRALALAPAALRQFPQREA